MAYSAFTSVEIEVGKSTKKELFQKVKDNFDDHESRIAAVEQTAIQQIMNCKVIGDIENYSSSQILQRSPVWRAPFDGSIISFVATLLTVSTSGTLSFQLYKSIDNGVNWTPLLSSATTLTGTTVGSQNGSVTFVNAESQLFDQGDLLRVDITTVQVGQGDFQFSMDAELS